MIPPFAVNVELIDKDTNPANLSCWKDFSICTNKIIIPILARRKQKWVTTTVMGGEGFLPSKVQIRRIFPLEPASAITVHKAQGRTIKKVILCLSDRKMKTSNMSYASLYVAMSRVKSKNDIRLFLHSKQNRVDWESISYVATLTPCKAIASFFEGFKNDNKSWDPKIALEKYENMS